MDDSEAFRAAPSDADVERAIASVPGVADALVRRSTSSGRSSLRIRVAPGEDPRKVSWAVAATLRERFSIVLDPDDIRPREQEDLQPTVRSPRAERSLGDHEAGPPQPPRSPSSGEPASDEPASEQPASEPASEQRASDDQERGRVRQTGEETSASGQAQVPPPAEHDETDGDSDRLVAAARDALAELNRPAPEVDAAADPVVGGDADAVVGADADAVVGGDADPGVGGDADAVVGADADPVADGDPGTRRGPRVPPPWPVSTDRSSRWVRREDPPFTTMSGETAPGHVRRPRAAEPAEAEPSPGGQVPRQPQQGPMAPSQPRSVDMAAPGQAGRPSGGTASVGAPPPVHRTASSEAPVVAVPPVTSHGVVAREVRTPRAAIRHLDTRRDERDVRVTATLERGGRSARGEITTVPTTRGVFRAVAEATIAALGALVGPQLVAGVDRVSMQPADDPASVMVVISLVTERGEETLLGTSVVRGDPEHAVMRATLDALNRRVGDLAHTVGPSMGDPAA